MEPVTPPTTVAPRKQVRLRLRPDLRVEGRQSAGRTWYLVKDPVTRQYYRFQDREYFLLRLLDGRHTLEEARRAFEEQFPPHPLTADQVEGFARLLITTGLAQGDSPATGRLLFRQHCRQQRRPWTSLLTSLFYLKVPLVNPDRLLGRFLRSCPWLTTPWSLLAGAGLMAAALVLVAAHWDTFQARLPSFHEWLNGRTVIALWLALGLVKVLHEFGHGLSCKALGGEVHEMGLLFLFFSPCLYCDVTDAWLLPGKWQRILISFAGIYVELLAAALATFAWWHTAGSAFLHHLCLCLMVVCSVHTVLLNANPLLRFDGYYMLADWLEVPNLRERADRALRTLLLGLCLGIRGRVDLSLGRGRRRFLPAYALASLAYRGLVTAGICWFLLALCRRYHLAALGTLLTGIALASIVGVPLFRVLARLRRGRLPAMKPRRVLATVTILGTAALLAAWLPLPLGGLRQTGLVQVRSDAQDAVFVPAAAFLEQLHVRDGQRVRPGDILAEFRSPEIETQQDETRCEYDIRQVQWTALRDLAEQTRDPHARARLDVLLADVAGERDLYARHLEMQEELARKLVLRAPRAGVVLGCPRPEEIGKLWSPDDATPVCTVADPRRLRVLVPLVAADYRLLRDELTRTPDLTVAVHASGAGTQLHEGRVSRLPEAEARTVPLSLTLRGGGPLPVHPGTRPEVLVPETPQYLVAVDFETADTGIVPGTLAQVKFRCQWRPAGWWLWRTLTFALDWNGRD